VDFDTCLWRNIKKSKVATVINLMCVDEMEGKEIQIFPSLLPYPN
jgi:hypothetical protein